jgi:N-dimethylarginine dimethylaminohydrolase
LTQCLNVIDDKILIFEDAFKEHALYILSTWYNLINRIPVLEEDMKKMAINSILLGDSLIMAYCSNEFEEKLSLKGLSVIRREVDYLTNFGTKSLVVAYE